MDVGGGGDASQPSRENEEEEEEDPPLPKKHLREWNVSSCLHPEPGVTLVVQELSRCCDP